MYIWSQVGLTLTSQILLRHNEHALSPRRGTHSVCVQLVLTQQPLLSMKSTRVTWVGRFALQSGPPPQPHLEDCECAMSQAAGSMSGDECVHVHGHQHQGHHERWAQLSEVLGTLVRALNYQLLSETGSSPYCDGQTPQWPSIISCFLVPMPLCYPLPLSVCRNCYLLLINRT